MHNTPRTIVVLSCVIWIACGDDTTDPDPQLIDVSISGRITDIFTNEPLDGSTVTVRGVSAVTDGDGQYSLNYTVRHITEEQQIVISGPGFQRYTTYAEYSIEDGRQSFALVSDQPDSLIPGSTIAQSVNQIARTDGSPLNLDSFIRRWDKSITPRFVINTTGMDNRVRTDIEEVVQHEIELLTAGHVTNASNIEYVDTNPTDLTGVILYHFGVTAVKEAVFSEDGYLWSGARIALSNGVTRGKVLHETAHVMGHRGHYQDIVGSVMDIGVSVHIADNPIDKRNAKFIYNRPLGSTKPDNDPLPTPSSATGR